MKHLAWIVYLLLVIAMTPRPAIAQQPCWDTESKGNSQYPEIDSKCVTTNYSSDRADFSAEVPGPQFKPDQGDNDPGCADAPAKVSCRTLCGDLPPNKQPGALGPQGIIPGGWARFEQHLMSFPRGNHYRVCLRLKNWAYTNLMGSGTPKRFNFTVMYATTTASNVSASTTPTTPSLHTVKKGENLALIARSAYGSPTWNRIYKANRDKIRDPNIIFPGQVLQIPQ
jgi:nucleoid-associated protein YgaU